MNNHKQWIIRAVMGSLICMSATCFGQTLYKWKDENGKWRFSDQPPTDASTAVEEAPLREMNSTSTQETNQALQKVFPKETPEEAAHRQQKLAQEKKKQARTDDVCRQARKRLDIIRGRVVFLDDKGKAVQVSEEERHTRAVALEKEIKQYCR